LLIKGDIDMNNIMSASKFSALCFTLFGFILYVMPLQASFATAGCCSRHGGVSHCDARTGYLMCNDNSQSPGCVCDKSKAAATVAAESKAKLKETKAVRMHEVKTAKEVKTTPKVTKAHEVKAKKEVTKAKETKAKKEAKAKKVKKEAKSKSKEKVKH
jgi:hypothetical protein